MNLVKSIIKFILITTVIGLLGAGTAVWGFEELKLDILGRAGTILLVLSPIIAGLWLYRQIKEDFIEARKDTRTQISELKQKNLLKRRFHGKQRLIDKTDGHRADLTRDLNKKTNKDKQDEILAEFFAGINLDMKAIKFSEAKEIVLEELKNKKTTK